MKIVNRKESSKRYDKRMTVSFCIKLNKKTDADIIEVLQSQDNIQGYIKECIRRRV